MKTIIAVAFLFSASAASQAAPLPFEELLYKGRALTFYNNASDPAQQKLIDVAKSSQLAERMATVAQSTLRLQRDLGVGFESCGRANAFFSHQRSSVVMCSEFIELIVKVAFNDKEFAMKLERPQFAQLVDGVIWGVYFHELAHAVIGINRVPITGREEDVADQFAVWYALHYVDQSKQPIVIPTIWFYRQLGKARDLSTMNADSLKHLLADEHSLDDQRLYNLACWSYGAGQETGTRVAQLAGLTQERAQRCPSEFRTMNDGMKSRFKRYFKTIRQ